MTDRAERRLSPISQYPVHPLLFGAYAVLFLYSENLADVLVVDAGKPITTAVLQALVAYAVASILLRSARRGAVVASALLVAWYGFGHAAPMLADAGLKERQQIGLWLLFLGAAIAYAVFAHRSLPRVTALLNIFAAVLVTFTFTSIIPYEASRATRSAAAVDTALAGSGGPATKRDVYFLIFDRYGSPDALETAFGITDNDLYDWLEQRGFQVQRNSHANYRATDFSLAATLNMTYLDGLTETVGRASGDRTPAQAMLRDHRVGKEFQAMGYRYVHLGSWFGPTASIPWADENMTAGVTSEFESVLRDTTMAPAIERAQGGEKAATNVLRAPRRHPALRVPAAQPAGVGAGTQVRLRAHPAAARSVRLPGGRLALHGGGGPAHGRGGALRRAAGVHECADQGPHRDAHRRRRRIGPDHHRAGRRRTARLSQRGLRGGRPALLPYPLREPERDVPAGRGRRGARRHVVGEYVPVPVPRGLFGQDLDLLPDRSFTWPDNDHIYDFRDVTDEIPPG